MPIVVSAESLTKRYGDLLAVDGISFDVEQGECFGFLGPNGAGKTTTIKMIQCFSQKTSGKLEVFGMDVGFHPKEIKRILGVVPQENNLDPTLQFTRTSWSTLDTSTFRRKRQGKGLKGL